VSTYAREDGGAPVDRRAEERARFLDRTTDLDRREALALAHSELGASRYGAADEIDATPGTVETYLDRATARYGPAVVVRHAPPVDADLKLVDDGDVLAWTELEREAWLDAAREHRDLVPDGVAVPSDAEENL
jgi:hypothetical protein